MHFTLHSDIDECAIGSSGCSQLCNNTIGSYVCLCNPGYQLSSDNESCIGEFKQHKTVISKHITSSYADINECLPNGGLGPCAQNCTNTIGSLYCSCQPGYNLSGYICNGKWTHLRTRLITTFADINECLPNGGLGPCAQNCTNTIGSLYCSCQPGYNLSGYICNGKWTHLRTRLITTFADINECLPNGGLGPCAQNCTNTIGSFYCSCLPGYTLSGYACNGKN